MVKRRQLCLPFLYPLPFIPVHVPVFARCVLHSGHRAWGWGHRDGCHLPWRIVKMQGTDRHRHRTMNTRKTRFSGENI